MKRINNSQEIINLIKDYDYISFDLFDTLIKRDVHKPVDVFQIVEDNGYPRFKENRINAEKKARLASKGREITYDDIYARLDKQYAACKSREIDTEKKICTQNLFLKKVYDYCIEHGKTIIITTDIYLGRDIIETILLKCGYVDYNYLFVSSEHGCMKADGKLFNILLNVVRIDAKELIHIGDNEHSDYEIPKHKGIASVLVDGKVDNLSYAKFNGNIKEDYWAAFTNNHLSSNDYFFDTGFECFGPLLYGFTKWLIKELEAEKIRKVFFLSRDGQIMKKAFDLAYKGEIQSEYLYVSRKALLVPSLKTYKTVDDYKNAYHFPFSFTTQKLCKMIGCENKKIIEQIIEETNTKDHVFYRDAINSDSFFDLVYYKTCDTLSQTIEEQYMLFRHYLHEKNFEGRVAIVDIGWHGNMQKNLEALTSSYGIDRDIFGYYVAMTPSEDLVARKNMKGYVFDSFHNQELDRREQLFNAAFELLFTGDHGTVLGYKDNTDVEARMALFEIEDADSLNLIRKYQAGALEFCKTAIGSGIFDEPPIEYITGVLFSQFLAPNLYDAKSWGNVTHEDNGSKKLVSFKGCGYYVLHPSQMLKDYHNSIWKIGFLRQLIKKNGFYDKTVLRLNSLMKLIRGR